MLGWLRRRLDFIWEASNCGRVTKSLQISLRWTWLRCLWVRTRNLQVSMSNKWVSKDKSNKLNLPLAVPITIEEASRVSLMVLLVAKAMVDIWSHQWLPISHFHLAMFATDVKSLGITSKIAQPMLMSLLTPTKVRESQKSISGREISGSVLRNSLKTSLRSLGRS